MLLLMVGARPSSWSKTLRGSALALSSGIFGVVPLLGAVVFVACPIQKVLAYRAFHKTTGARAAAAVLLPVVFLGLCCAGINAVLLAVRIAEKT